MPIYHYNSTISLNEHVKPTWVVGGKRLREAEKAMCLKDSLLFEGWQIESLLVSLIQLSDLLLVFVTRL